MIHCRAKQHKAHIPCRKTKNGVIISEPHASFLERWRASYQDFSSTRWDEHSIKRPWQIARRYPYEVQVLSSGAFFTPEWWGDLIPLVHERNEWDFKATGQYAYHAWETKADKYLSVLDPNSVQQGNSSFHRMVRE